MLTPYQAQAAPSLTHIGARPRPNPAAGAEIVSYFLDCLDLFIRKAVEEALSNSRSAPHAATSPDKVGGMKLAQEVTGLSKPRLYALVSERGIPHKKRGNRLFFDREELLAWIAEGNRAVRKQNER
ncbi:helix-turn-helix domain-containing protein [Hymenobacter sp. BRD67]|nr:helix-turn-helix domain-containing protein [Hymenobacter sp. BRD67]